MQSPLFSERLSITALNTTDARFIFELVNTEGWLKFIGNRNIHNQEDSLSYIQKNLIDAAINYWVVRLKFDNTPIGIISLVKRIYTDHPDIGFAFLPSAANNGYAYEAAKAVMNHVFNNTDHSSIIGITLGKNIRSIKVLKKLGFQFQKEIKVENEKLQVFIISKEKHHISDIAKSFFSSFTNKENGIPNLDLIRSVCIPEAVIINKKQSEITIYSVASFITPREKILTDGSLLEFEEKEISEITKFDTTRASRYSSYEKCGILNGKKFKQQGHKLFQFIKLDHAWKISTVIWEDNEN